MKNYTENLNTRVDPDRKERILKRMKTLKIEDMSAYMRRLIDNDIGPKVSKTK